MTLQPFDDPLRIVSHSRDWRVVHVLEDGVQHRAGTLDEPLDVLVVLAVDVRKEEELLLASLDHETGEMHGPEIVLHFREIGHQRGQLFGQRFGVGGSLDREVDDEMTLAHGVLLSRGPTEAPRTRTCFLDLCRPRDGPGSRP